MTYYLNCDERIGDMFIINESELDNDLGLEKSLTMRNALYKNYHVIRFDSWIELARYVLKNTINPKKHWNVLKHTPGFPF